MSEEWVETTLGATCTFVKQRVTPSSQPSSAPYVGLEHIDESTTRVTRTSRLSEVSSLVSSFHRGDTLFGRLRPYLRKVACADFAGFCSPEILVLRPHPASIESGYLHLVASSDSAIEHAVAVSAGSRMPRTSESDLAGFEFKLPPLAVQRRIVDLMTHLDNHLANLRAERDALAQLEEPLCAALFLEGSEGAEPVPLGSVGEFIRGRRFTKDEYTTSGLGCIHYGQLHTVLGPMTTKPLTFLPEESRQRLRLARAGDVVIAATSEDVEGLGKATVWLGDEAVAVHDDCQIFRHQLDPKFAAFVFASPWFQDQKRQYAGGTKVTRISGSDLAKVLVPIPSRAVQERIGEVLLSLNTQSNGIGREVARGMELRAALLNRLLSGSVAIPTEHDNAFGAVV